VSGKSKVRLPYMALDDALPSALQLSDERSDAERVL
jgi:hypothetical protein